MRLPNIAWVIIVLALVGLAIMTRWEIVAIGSQSGSHLLDRWTGRVWHVGADDMTECPRAQN
jgi:hypothetical protein